MGHPELGEAVNELINDIKKSEVGLVWCHGCGCQRMVNSAYLPFLTDGITNCRFCRESSEE